MKKIGIISYFNYYNYGSMLQGYALQKYINEMGEKIECELINYRSMSQDERSVFHLLMTRIKRFWVYMTHLREVTVKAQYGSKKMIRNSLFDRFLQDYTKVSSVFYRTLRQLIDNPPVYDLYVTGSDQTWSPNVSGGYDETPMFLDFAVAGAKKAAYAPCLGVNSFTKEQEDFLKTKLVNYSLISCREVRGAELLSRIVGKQVTAVVDPTLLLTGGQWREIMEKPRIKHPYIFCYFLGDRQYYRDFACQLSKQTGLPIYYIPMSWKEFGNSDYFIWDAGPREFVGLVDDAEYVLTDSFHGVAFSSNLNKNFYAFVKHAGNANAGDNSRLFDYLNRIGLVDRLVLSYNGDNIVINDIDYTMVNEKLVAEREKSYSYLNKLVEL